VLATLAVGMALSHGSAWAASGDNLTTFDASITAGIPACSIGTGIAYDGTNLILSCWGSNVLERVNAATHLNSGAVTISGLPFGNSIEALAWDATRGRLWACNSQGNVVLINVGAGAVDGSVPAFAVPACTDGLAYDGSDDTLWLSPDADSTVYHYTTGGSLIASFGVGGLLGGCGNSGIAVGGPDLYLANNGCSQIYTVNKTVTTSTLFATFPARLEDLECDGRTFSPKGAIWSLDAYDRILNAWEIAPGLCTFGGLAECGDGIVDPGEQCDDGNLINGDGCDANCQDEAGGCSPPDCNDGNPCTDDSCGSVGGAFVCNHAPNTAPCDDGDTCTGPDVCSGGTCTPGPSSGTCVDHYKCYKSRGEFQPRSVSLVDQFGQSTATVLRSDRFCNPVDKNNEGITDPDAHLNCYKIREPRGTARDVVVSNQFGELQLTTTRSHTLCVPAIKDQIGNLNDLNINHFKCYRVRPTPGAPKFTERDVQLNDQFEMKATTVIKPFLLCNPVDKNGEGVPDPTNHITCYKIKDVSGQPPFVPVQPNVTDQFVVQDLQTSRRTDCGKTRLLCVPSSKRIASPSGAFLDGGAGALLE